ncbi:MAG: nickel insertion protein [Eggerthellaceae bacterium]|jgi:uncharacterized protein (DUF111 family)
MYTLHINLSKTATRQYLLSVLMDELDAAQRDSVESQMSRTNLSAEHYHRLAEVEDAIEGTGLPAEVRADARAVYHILAEAEAAVHGVPVDQTHFHEVGDAEAVRNVIAVCLAVHELSPVRIVATPVQTGSGKVRCAHGLLDIPAPATAAILARGIPTCAQTVEGEQCTPTSAALIAHFVKEFEA